jgi:hypothetical protein
MRIEVGTVNKISRVCSAGAAVVSAIALFAVPNTGPAGAPERAIATCFAAGYCLTMLAFSGFPRARRTDIVKVIVAAGALLEVGRYLIGAGYDGWAVVATTAGATAVLVTSFVERFRLLVRIDPTEPFSMVYPINRRRRATKPSTVGAEAAS